MLRYLCMVVPDAFTMVDPHTSAPLPTAKVTVGAPVTVHAGGYRFSGSVASVAAETFAVDMQDTLPQAAMAAPVWSDNTAVLGMIVQAQSSV